MDYQVVTMEDFQLLGKGEMQLVGQVKADLFWQKCQKDGTLAKLTTYSTSDEKEWIGLADGESFDGEGYSITLRHPIMQRRFLQDTQLLRFLLHYG